MIFILVEREKRGAGVKEKEGKEKVILMREFHG